MNFVYETARTPAVDTSDNGAFGGGIATLSEISGASYDSALYVDNFNSSEEILERAVQDRLDAVEQATGRKLLDPFSHGFFGDYGPSAPLDPKDRIAMMEAELSQLQEEFPDKADAIRANISIADDAKNLAVNSEERLSRFMQSRTDFFGKWGAVLAGGIAGALNDPVQQATMLVSLPGSAAKTVGGRVLQTAGREMVLNAGVETILQPAVQAHRKAVGLDNGFDLALQNILFAGAIGASFGGSVQAIGEGIQRLAKSGELNAVTDEVAKQTNVPDIAKRVLDGDEAAARELLEPVRDQLPPEVRSSLDRVDVPETGNAAENFIEARQSIITGQPAEFIPDEKQVYRIAETLIDPIEKSKTGNAPATLLQFLADRGGLQDFKGELRVMDAHLKKVQIGRRKRPLVSKKGMTLDGAVEAAEQAGYLSPSDPNQPAKYAINDLLDQIDQELSGKPIYSQFDGDLIDSSIDTRVYEDELEAAANHVREISTLAGPNLPDELIQSISDLRINDGLSLDDAVERAIMSAPEPSNRAAQSEILPGWSDDELIAASEMLDPPSYEVFEGPEPDTVRASTDDTQLDIDENFAVVDPDTGEIVSVKELTAAAGRDAELADILGACRV